MGCGDDGGVVDVAAKPRVLLVDDSRDLRLLLRILLDNTGEFEVAGEAGDGAEAIQLAATLQPDLVVLDVAMPQMSGLQAIAELRRVSPAAKVVLLSGFDTGAMTESAKAHGVDAYIYKATPPEELVGRLAEIAGVRRGSIDEGAADDWPESALRDAQGSLQGAFDEAAIGLAVVSLEGRIITVNQALCDILGAPADELIGRDTMQWVDVDHAPEAIAQAERMRAGESTEEFLRARVQRHDGRLIWIERQRSLVRDEQGRALFALAQVRDISRLKAAEDALRESEQRFQAGFDHAPIGMALLALDGTVTRVNRAMCDLLDRPAPELEGSDLSSLAPEDARAGMIGAMRALANGDQEFFAGELSFLRPDGAAVHTLSSAVLVRNAFGHPVQVYAQVVDITERKRAEAVLTFHAERDSLTGLYNRRRFLEELERHEDLARRHRVTTALILFDLDGFKRVNDELGHPAGDDVLGAVAAALQERLRRSDIIARFGGDEFVVLLPHTDKDDAVRVAEELVAAVGARAAAVATSTPMSISAGLAMIDADHPAGAVARADKAMYRAKRTRGGLVTE